MTDAELERGYRRWLRWYPKSFRREHGAEILGVLMAGAREGQRQPELMECLDLMRSAVSMRLRPRAPRSDRSVFNAVKLMYVGAVVELAAAITILATIGDARSNVVKRNPGLTEIEWHAVVAGQLEPKAVAAGIAVGFWLWMAWFFGLNTFGLLDGLARGSVVYARADLAIGIVLWLVELAAVALIFHVKIAVSKIAVSQPGASRIAPGASGVGRGRMSGRCEAPKDSSWQETGVEAKPPAADARTQGSSGARALSVDHLAKQFGDRIAFDDVSFEVGHGEVFGFLGPNGAGKTTTVRTLGTLIAPTSGSAMVAGMPLTPENGVEIRRRISIMPESPGLYLRLSVVENLECFAELYETPDPTDRIDRALRVVNLVDRAGDACGALSKGLRQRVALARALLSDPEILFLDEPTAGLDPAAARDVHELIPAPAGSGARIFLPTHPPEEAERLCDRVAILNTTLRTIGRPAELRDQLFARTLTVKTLAPLGDPGGVFGGLPAVDGWHQDGPVAYVLAISDAAVAAPAVTRALVKAGADVLSISESHHSLEDVYLELIAENETVRGG